MLAISPLRQRYAGVEEGLMLVDLAVLAGFITVALRSKRFWPLWVAGLQLTTSIGHVLKGIDQDLLPRAYGAALQFWSYPILIDPGGRHLSQLIAGSQHSGLARSTVAPIKGRRRARSQTPLPLAILDAIEEPALIVERRYGGGRQPGRARRCSAARSSVATCASPSATARRSIRSWPAARPISK